MSLYFNNFNPYAQNQQFDNDYDFYQQEDMRTFGFPGGPGSAPGGGQAGGPPTTPPPAYVPQEQMTAFAVDPGGIRRCMYRFTYIWLIDGRSFWFYPIFLGRNSIAGWRWSRRRGWVYYGTDLRQIRSFQC
ncbi:collagen-like protein [Mesobacillus jeotgali]|uniref:Collagen-like protein n=1 Tax=Mesobacillus jeotgali TaxID=129985 RepID=A0ABY9VJ52_9BACI|nr:collagen-like protein [Mesobacillus jeotgali]WNF22897.1 collagen-like protein [Mesobacillus jeotgali]